MTKLLALIARARLILLTEELRHAIQTRKRANAADIKLPEHTPVRTRTMSRELVRQIEKGAIDKVAAALKERGLTASDLL